MQVNALIPFAARSAIDLQTLLLPCPHPFASTKRTGLLQKAEHGVTMLWLDLDEDTAHKASSTLKRALGKVPREKTMA